MLDGDETLTARRAHRFIMSLGIAGLLAASYLFATAVNSGGAEVPHRSTAAHSRNSSAAAPAQSVVGMALQFAAANGDPTPTSVNSEATTRGAALAQVDPEEAVVADGATNPSGDAAILVVMAGSFTGYMAKVPPGTPAPTGSSLWMVVDEATSRVTDWGLG